MHSNFTIKNVSWPHFSWATMYIQGRCVRLQKEHQIIYFEENSALCKF